MTSTDGCHQPKGQRDPLWLTSVSMWSSRQTPSGHRSKGRSPPHPVPKTGAWPSGSGALTGGRSGGRCPGLTRRHLPTTFVHSGCSTRERDHPTGRAHAPPPPGQEVPGSCRALGRATGGLPCRALGPRAWLHQGPLRAAGVQLQTQTSSHPPPPQPVGVSRL